MTESPISGTEPNDSLHVQAATVGGQMLLINLGDRMRMLRKGRKMSQEKFALMILMDRTYYASVEAGRRNISILNLHKIAQGFEISISELVEGAETSNHDRQAR